MHSVNAKRCLTVLAATTLLSFSASSAQAQWFGFYWNWPSWGYSRPYYAGYRPYAYTSYYAPTVASYSASYAPVGGAYTSYYASPTYDPCCSCAPPCCDPCSNCCSACGAGGCYGGACASGNCPGGNCTVNDSSSWSASGGREPTPADSRGPARTFGDEDQFNPRDEGRDDPVLPSRGFEPRDRSRDNLDSSPADDLYRPRTRSVEPPDPGFDSTTPDAADSPMSPMAPFSRPPRDSSGDAFGGDSGAGDRESFRLPSSGDDTEPSTIPQKQPAPAITPPDTTPSTDDETDTTPTLKLDNKSTWRMVAERSRVKIRSNWPAPSLARRNVKAPATNWEPVPSETKVAGK